MFDGLVDCRRGEETEWIVWKANHRKDNMNRCLPVGESMWTNRTDGRNTKHFANYLAAIYFKRLCCVFIYSTLVKGAT